MWQQSGGSLQSVLIVAKENGSVFIVEDNRKNSQVEKILKDDKKNKKRSRNEPELKTEREFSPVHIKAEIKTEPFDVISDDESYERSFEQVTFIDPNAQMEEIQIKVEPEVKTEHYEMLSPKREVKTTIATFDGHYTSSSSEEEYGDRFQYVADSEDGSLINSKDEMNKINLKIMEKKKHFRTGSQRNFQKRKLRSLVGKLACKYCDIIFKTKNQKDVHDCPYLQCDPKNFICRICSKELSRKTFSNHLHETLDCQYCYRKFVNPRNLTRHIAKNHTNEDYIPPKEIDRNEYLKNKEIEEITNTNKSDEPLKARSARHKKKLECDLCGKYLVSIRSLKLHMSLHTGESKYICETCGEKFYTPGGIKGHSCVKKRRRPDNDYRTRDCRFCRFCDQHFENFDKKTSHICPYICSDDKNVVICRICAKVLPKLAFNRHMEVHDTNDHICSICGRQLATARALKVHTTTHTGNKPYPCTKCNQSFINKNVLDRHMRFHGVSIAVFKCHVCFRQLSTETSLKSHLKRLHNPNVFCELCKLEFPDREVLRHHLTTAHEPSVCLTCGKSFSLPRYLKSHEKLHFDDTSNRIACSICSKMLDIKNIKTHVFRHHPEQFTDWQAMHTQF